MSDEKRLTKADRDKGRCMLDVVAVPVDGSPGALRVAQKARDMLRAYDECDALERELEEARKELRESKTATILAKANAGIQQGSKEVAEGAAMATMAALEKCKRERDKARERIKAACREIEVRREYGDELDPADLWTILTAVPVPWEGDSDD